MILKSLVQNQYPKRMLLRLDALPNDIIYVYLYLTALLEEFVLLSFSRHITVTLYHIVNLKV